VSDLDFFRFEQYLIKVQNFVSRTGANVMNAIFGNFHRQFFFMKANVMITFVLPKVKLTLKSQIFGRKYFHNHNIGPRFLVTRETAFSLEGYGRCTICQLDFVFILILRNFPHIERGRIADKNTDSG
jgi:hypothetical protein